MVDWGKIPEWVSEYVGVPYEIGGRSLQGADCWGLFALVHQRKGVELPQYNGPDWSFIRAEQLSLSEAAKKYADLFSEIEAGTEQLYDGILLRMMGVPIHLGMVVAPGIMLHTEMGADSSLECYDSIYWKNRIIAFYRHNG